MNKYTLFLSVYGRDMMDGGMNIQGLDAQTIEEARIEAKAIIAKDYPEDDCDHAVESYAIAECVSIERVGLIS